MMLICMFGSFILRQRSFKNMQCKKKLFGKKLEHFSNDAFQLNYDLSQVN